MPRAIDSTETKILKWFLTAPLAGVVGMLSLAVDAVRSRKAAPVVRYVAPTPRKKVAKKRPARRATPPPVVKKAAPKKSYTAPASDGLTIGE